MSKLKKVEDEFIEVVDTGPTYYLEEDISIDEKYVKNKSLIRMDMNIVQFPIFSKNTKRKKNEITTYYFNKNRDTYITVKPSAGDLIPGEGEERVFIALMKLMKEKGMGQEFYVTAKEIKEAARINAGNYTAEVKKALLRLSETNYNFKNTMYSNEINSIIRDEISTPILTFKSRSLEENKDLRKEYKDKRIKEIYFIKISDHIYRNIVKRGYLVYDSNILLNINSSVARTLYMLLEKIRYKDLYVKESVFALIKKIPLKYEKKSLPITIKTLEKSFKELVEKKLIESFKFIKTTTWLEADVEVFFSENHNLVREEQFEEDNNQIKNIYGTLAISFTEKIPIENLENNKNEKLVTNEMVQEIISILPKKALSLKTMPKTIYESIEHYGYNKVEKVARYIKANKVEKIRAYFLKALKENWSIEDEEIYKPVIKVDEEKNIDKVSKEEINGKLFEEFQKLNQEEQDRIEKIVYDSYIKACGVETQIQKNSYKLARRSLICNYLVENENLIKDSDKKNKTTEEKVIDINFFNEYLNKSIEVYKLILNLTEERIFEIKKEILVELTPKLVQGTITLDEINKVLAEKIK